MTDAMKERIQIKEAIRALRVKGMKMGDVSKVVHESLNDVLEEERILWPFLNGYDPSSDPYDGDGVWCDECQQWSKYGPCTECGR